MCSSGTTSLIVWNILPHFSPDVVVAGCGKLNTWSLRRNSESSNRNWQELSTKYWHWKKLKNWNWWEKYTSIYLFLIFIYWRFNFNFVICFRNFGINLGIYRCHYMGRLCLRKIRNICWFLRTMALVFLD